MQSHNHFMNINELSAHKTKKDVLCEKIVEMITTGLLRDQDDLPSERELAKLFEVSRETVRGALAKIAAYGLIHVSQGNKTRINASEETLSAFQHLHQIHRIDVNRYNVDDVFIARQIIETAITRLAASKITDDILERLDDLVRAQEEMYSDPVRFQLSDQYFHKTLAESADNALLLKYSSELYNYGLVVRRQVLSLPDAVRRSVEEHKVLVAALAARDETAAVTAMQRHLQSVYDTSKAASQDILAGRR